MHVIYFLSVQIKHHECSNIILKEHGNVNSFKLVKHQQFSNKICYNEMFTTF